MTTSEEEYMNKILDVGINYLNAVYWAIECEEYVDKYVIGRKWTLNTGDKEAFKIMRFAHAEEKHCFRKMEEALTGK